MLQRDGDSINTTFFCIPQIKAASIALELTEHQYYSPYHFYYCPSFDHDSIYDLDGDPEVDRAEIIPSSGAAAYSIRNDCDSNANVHKPVVRRSLTHPLTISTEDAMTLSVIEDAQATMPGSPRPDRIQIVKVFLLSFLLPIR